MRAPSRASAAAGALLGLLLGSASVWGMESCAAIAIETHRKEERARKERLEPKDEVTSRPWSTTGVCAEDSDTRKLATRLRQPERTSRPFCSAIGHIASLERDCTGPSEDAGACFDLAVAYECRAWGGDGLRSFGKYMRACSLGCKPACALWWD